MTDDSSKTLTEEQKILLALTRSMDSSLLKWDDTDFGWHGQGGSEIRERAAAYLVHRCLKETDAKFQDLAARVAIEVNDAALLKALLPRLDVRYSACDTIVRKAVKSHNPEFYTLVREFWKTIEPKTDNFDDPDYGKTYHLRFADALQIALADGTPEVFDVVYKEFNEDMDPMVAVINKNWVLVEHLLNHYTILPGKLADMANALRVAKKDELVQRAMALGFRPNLSRDPYENIIDMVHETDFQEMLKNPEKLQVLPKEAAYRLIASGQYDRIEAVLEVLSKIPAEKQIGARDYFVQGLRDKFCKLRENGKYAELAELFRLFKTFDLSYGYGVEHYFSASAATSDINAVETFFSSGLKYEGGVTAHTPPQPASPAFVQYLVSHGHSQLAESVIVEFLDFDHSREEEDKKTREDFYFKCIEGSLISEETFQSILHPREYHLTTPIVEHIILTGRIIEPILPLMNRVWPGYMTPKLMEYFLSQDKEGVLKTLKWNDWVKYFITNKKIEVVKLIVAAGYEVSSTERATATKSKNEAMIALLARKKERKHRKA